MKNWEESKVHKTNILFCFSFVALVGTAASANADTFTTYGDVVSTPAGFVATSDGAPTAIGYAGLELQLSPQISLSSITQLSADYTMTIGTIGGGSPRFTIFDPSFNSAYVYFGTPVGGGTFTDPNSGSTGNYANLLSSDLRVASNGFGGIFDGNTYETWAQFVAASGTVDVSYVTLDVDGSFSQPGNIQQALLNNFTVNNDVLSTAAVPEPSTWAMMILGFAGIGAMAHRRRKSAMLAA
jgi:hypothetical protein